MPGIAAAPGATPGSAGPVSGGTLLVRRGVSGDPGPGDAAHQGDRALTGTDALALIRGRTTPCI